MVECSRGNDDAFAELFRRHYESIFRFAYRFCQNEEAAAEVTQETFLRIYAARARYSPTSRFTTYLRRVATNICLNELRSARRHPTVPFDVLQTDDLRASRLANVPAPQPTPAEHLEQKELEQHVKRAIARLPEKQRIAVVLRRYDELSYEEIASILGCSVEAVDGLLQRARQKLKSYLGKYRTAK
jgi:RNA polymerase sigma-70 factor (ECF subfamily)